MMMEISKLEREISKLEPSCCNVNGTSKEVKKSYIHGCTNAELLFDTIGERLRLAAKKVVVSVFLILIIANIVP